MANVGILTCSNSVQELGCSSVACFDAAYAKTGQFAGHEGDIRIKGMVSCAGCPGKQGFGKILRKVNSLLASGVEILHLGNCMVSFCPFLAKYEAAIQEAHPGLAIVRGVHDTPFPESMMEKVGERIMEVFTAQRPTTPEIIREFAG